MVKGALPFCDSKLKMAVYVSSSILPNYIPNPKAFVAPTCLCIVSSARRSGQKTQKKKPKSKPSSTTGFGAGGKEAWRCVEGCGACCKLAKGPAFATPEEIFSDPSDVELYRSLIGADGWCIHYDRSTRKCSIYPDRPYFCRVKPDVFKSSYGIDEKRFNKEACSCCRDTIKAIYGSHSQELEHFNHSVRGSGSSQAS